LFNGILTAGAWTSVGGWAWAETPIKSAALKAVPAIVIGGKGDLAE
jgi:hypothetical protein